MDGYPGAMKSNPPVLEGPIELRRHTDSSWSSGDNPRAILGVVVTQSGAKWHIFQQRSLSLAMEPNPGVLESHHGKRRVTLVQWRVLLEANPLLGG
jgi:hypothetical protein